MAADDAICGDAAGAAPIYAGDRGAQGDEEDQVAVCVIAAAASPDACDQNIPTDSASLDHDRADIISDLDVSPESSTDARPTRASSRLESARSSIYDALARPAASIATRLAPLRVMRASTKIVDRAMPFHKKALKVNAATAAQESHLKLGRMRSSDIAVLYRNIHVAVLAPSVAQLTHGVVSPKWSLLPNSVLLVGVLIVTTLYIRRIALYSARQPIQVKLLRLTGVIWVINAISLSAVIWTEIHPAAESSRQLLVSGNTLLAGLIYRILGHFNDHYARHVRSQPLHNNETSRRHQLKYWLRRCWARRFNALSTPVILVYMALRGLVSWRNDVVMDFLPMTNAITLARIILAHRTVQPPGLLRDTIVITAFDALLLAAALLKAWTTRSSFRTVFVRDFARVFTEFFVFVLHFRDTVVVVTVCGHLVCWFGDERHFVLIDDSATVKHLGVVQTQFGFQLSLLVWLTITLFCALPTDAVGLRGWIVGTSESNQHDRQQQHLKYFLFESNVYMKVTFMDLAHLEQINPSHFIMDRQIEAFNLAQLVYACGKRPKSTNESPQSEVPVASISEDHADQDDASRERQRLQQFVNDSNFTVVAVIENAGTDTHCVVLESLSIIAVAFRGTSSKKNAQTDLQAAMTAHLTAKRLDLSTLAALSSRLQGVQRSQSIDPAQLTAHARSLYHRVCCKRNVPKVHSGFYGAYLSVEKRVLDTVAALHRQDPRHILVTGHSLGGALAVLCSFNLVVRLELTNVTCTTFGCPRIGNTAFRKRYMLAVPATFVFVNAADVVTKLPPKTPKALSYVNVGHVALVNSLGNLVLEPSMLELAVLHRGLSAKAHALNAY